MPDLLTCLTIGARVVVLGYSITMTAKVIVHAIHQKEITGGAMLSWGFSIALFAGLMGWLD